MAEATARVARDPIALRERPILPPGEARRLTTRETIRRRLTLACALEKVPPERFGFSLETATRLFQVTSFFYRRYFRVRCFGVTSLPRGPFLAVANHGSHVLSWDGAMIVTACLLEGDPPRLLHGMAHHRLMQLPILGGAARRIGAVDGQRAACAELLRSGAAVLAFPEGVRALEKPFRERYRLRPFGPGFMHVALATGAPVVPVAVVGSEEEAPLLGSPRWLARLLGTPVAPIAPTLFVPLPVRYRVYFGPPLRFRGQRSASRAVSDAEHVQATLQALLDQGLRQRQHVFF